MGWERERETLKDSNVKGIELQAMVDLHTVLLKCVTCILKCHDGSREQKIFHKHPPNLSDKAHQASITKARFCFFLPMYRHPPPPEPEHPPLIIPIHNSSSRRVA